MLPAHAFACALTWACLQAGPDVGAGAPAVDDAARVTEAMMAIARAQKACDWPAVIARAEEARAIVRRGSDAWFEAYARQVVAQHEVWTPDTLERTARAALDSLAETRRANPRLQRSAVGPLHPHVAGFVLGLQINLAHVLQSRGLHVEALGHLRFVMDDLESGQSAGADGLMAEAGLDSAHSLLLLGRAVEARTVLVSLRDTFRGTRQAASASVLLQSAADDPSAYRGKYEGDAAQAQRMQALLSAVPRARARVAARLGWPIESLPEFPVGFVDLPSGMRAMGALTEGDARRPTLVPVVIVFSETLALDMLDLESLLVHELTHAALISACGPAYHRLPPWMAEGLSEAVADQTSHNMDQWLANRLAAKPREFAGRSFWKSNALVFDGGPCGKMPTPEAGLAILPLVERLGLDGVRRIVAQFRAGKSLAEALKAVLDISVADYLALAHERVRAELESRRETAYITAHHLAVAGDAGPAAELRAAENAIEDLPDGIALGFAYWKRAQALGALGRHEESLAAHRGLLELRRRHPFYVELARMGEATALLALERRAEAASALRALERDALTPEVTRWAAEQTSRSR